MTEEECQLIVSKIINLKDVNGYHVFSLIFSSLELRKNRKEPMDLDKKLSWVRKYFSQAIDAGFNINDVNLLGDSILHVVIGSTLSKKEELISILIENGINPTLKNHEGKAAIDLIKNSQYSKEIDILSSEMNKWVILKERESLDRILEKNSEKNIKVRL